MHLARLWRTLLPTYLPIVAVTVMLVVSCKPRIQFRKVVAYVVQVIGVLIGWLSVVACRIPKRMIRMVWR